MTIEIDKKMYRSVTTLLTLDRDCQKRKDFYWMEWDRKGQEGKLTQEAQEMVGQDIRPIA